MKKIIIFIAVAVFLATLTPFTTSATTVTPGRGLTPNGLELGVSTPETQGAPRQANAEFKPIVPLPDVTTEMTYAAYINNLFKLVISLSAILAVLVIIYGGFEYMTASAGVTKKNGMERIQGAVTGLLLLMSVTLILQVINPCILEITLFMQTETETGAGECSRGRDNTTANSSQNANGNGNQSQEWGREMPVGSSCLVPNGHACGPSPVCFEGNRYTERSSSEGCQTGSLGYLCTNNCPSPAAQGSGWRVVSPGSQCEQSGATATAPTTYCCSVATPTREQFLTCNRLTGAQTSCSGQQANTVSICGGAQ